jgi:2-polyprenyl-3-methyl-5-hydroxy-6-metoxy-1,4-benzoquinol methylase
MYNYINILINIFTFLFGIKDKNNYENDKNNNENDKNNNENNNENNKNNNDIYNPFLLENLNLIKKIDQDIEIRITDNYDWNYYKWIPVYLKYKNKVSPSYFKFKIYDVLYDEETYIFEKDLIKIMKKHKNILDFGCGTCKIWRNNINFIKERNIHCIDLDIDALSYPKYLLKNNTIKITNDNLFNIDIKNYDCILFSEVIMQLENFDSIIKYIIKNNPNISIIVNHTIFNPIVSKLLTPIKNGLLKYIPIMNVGCGKALTYQQTIQMFTKLKCSLIYEKSVFDNKIIFVFKKSV